MIDWRALPYNLRWVKQLTWETLEGNCEVSPLLFPDNDSKMSLIFEISLSEFTKVLSALEKGATLSYPSDDWEVVWFFLRNFECPMPICEQIIACISTDIDTQEAIVSMLKGNDNFNEYITTTVRGLTEGQIGGKLIQGDCDDAVVAGRVKAIVDAMDQANKDWLEKIEVGTNDEEKFALALEAIPVLGELPFDQIIEFGEDILEDFTENYNAQVDAALLETWYCGLYCIAKENADCSLSYGEIYGYFSSRTTSGLNPFSALGDVVGFIRTGDFSGGTKVADGLMMLQTGLMANGREFMGSSLPTIAKAARDAGTATFYEDCDDCPDGDLWLVPILGSGLGLEMISSTETTQTYEITNYYTGHYLTGGGISPTSTPFYIESVDFNPAETGPIARLTSGSWTYPLDEVPCDLPTIKAGIYEASPGSVITITINRTGCPVGPWSLDGAGEILEQDASSIVLRGVLSGPWYQVAVVTEYPVCVSIDSGEATASDWDLTGYTPCDDDTVYFEMGTTLPSIPGLVRGMQFASNVPFDITMNFTQ